MPGYDKYKQHVLANPVFVGGKSNPFYHLQGAARGKGMMANSQFYRTDPKRNPLLRGGNDEELARRMAEFLAPHIASGVGQAADSIQDFFKTPEQREQEKRDKAALEEAERRKKETDENKWSSYLSPFFP